MHDEVDTEYAGEIRRSACIAGGLAPAGMSPRLPELLIRPVMSATWRGRDRYGLKAVMLYFIEQILNGVQLGMLLFLLAAGLTLIFGSWIWSIWRTARFT